MITENEIFSHFDSQISNISLSSKTLYKFWSGLTKLLHHLTIQKSEVSFEPFGYFSSTSPYFIPSRSLSDSLNYEKPEAYHSKTRISSSSLSTLCNLSHSDCKTTIKLLISHISTQVKLGLTVRLNLKVGYLVLQSSSFRFFPSKVLPSYNASNPNPINDDSSNNLLDVHREKILYSKVNLPPLSVQSKTNPTIISKHSRKQFIQPYVSAYELMKMQKAQIRDRVSSKTPENTSIVQINNRDEERLKERKQEFLENEKINKSMIQYKQWKKQQDQEIKQNEKFSYFPFVEGDFVEKSRRKINSERKQEYLDRIGQSPALTGIASKDILMNLKLISMKASESRLGAASVSPLKSRKHL